MTAINHALTGAVIGFVIGQPLIAVPVAVASHFVCDALPHYDSEPKGARVKTSSFRVYLMVEAALCAGFVLLLAVLHPAHWLLAAGCAFAATSPDLLWINRFIALSRHRPWRPGIVLRFADAIQWFARPIGAVVELAWFIGILVLLLPFLH